MTCFDAVAELRTTQTGRILEREIQAADVLDACARIANAFEQEFKCRPSSVAAAVQRSDIQLWGGK